MMKKLAIALSCASLLSLHVHAGVSADEAKKLGAELTPIGAEKAGNKDGTIPAYTGGLTTPPAGFDKSKGVRPDPFAGEKPQFSIDAKNMDKYADKLTEGAKSLMKQHADYRIDVYPTHRTVALPKFVLDNSIKNATRVKLSDDGLSAQGARAGIPFPIPKNGNEVMLNFAARFQGKSMLIPKFSIYNIDSSGKALLSAQGSFLWESPYYDESRGDDTSVQTRARTNYSGPARRAGEANMAIDPQDWATKDRRAWLYLPGQRRVRLAPDLSYDTPNPSTSGMSTYDDVNLFNGKQDRFDFKLVGKKEIYVPYNDYKMVYNSKPEEMLQPKFIDPSAVRWELHRVWVVDATLKKGQRHIYSRRTFYIDEDSWAILANDQYDGRGQLWRPGFSYMAPAYDVPSPNNSVIGHYDLIAGTYYVTFLPGLAGFKYADTLLSDSMWSGDSLAGQGVR